MPNSAHFRDLLLSRSLLDAEAFPTGVWMSLHLDDPGSEGIREVTGGNYARQPLVLVRTAAGTAANETPIEFDSMPKASLRYFGVWDAQEGGRFLTGGALLGPVELSAGQDLRYRETDLVLRIG